MARLDAPTQKLDSAELARYAREADDFVRVLEQVPVVVASKDDLSWFTLDDAARLVLDAIDGVATVAEVAAKVSLPKSRVVALLRDLAGHKAITFE